MSKKGVRFSFDMSEFKINLKKLKRASQEDKEKAAFNIAALLEKETKDRAPFKEGHLKASIKGDVQVDGKKVAACIYVPLNSPASQYAVKMHEGQYKLGEKSVAVQNKVGKTVGRKYITRAIEDCKEKIQTVLVKFLKL